MKQIKFQDYIKMCQKAAWEVTKTFFLEFEDVEAQSYLIYADAVERFDPNNGASFSTFLTWRLMTLWDFGKKEYRLKTRVVAIGENEVESIETNEFEKFQEVLDFYESADLYLSRDAVKVMAHMMDDYVGRKPSVHSVQVYCRRYLDWAPVRARRAWDEIKVWWDTSKEPNQLPINL